MRKNALTGEGASAIITLGFEKLCAIDSECIA